MNDIAARYSRLSDAFAAVVATVPEERWSSPSPCPDWTAREVVGHVVDTQGMFLGLVGRELGDVPKAADDPVASWDAARAVVLADLADPERAGTAFDGFFGRTTFAEAVDRFLNFDLIVHRWDLARATGGDERLDPDDVRWAREATAAFGDALRGDGVCGPELTPPGDADEQTRLLAFLGRRSW
ncbi:TIGR03086 family metal-binding protein [Nocardiopsis lambiniae]|uniref:TIGR03086 family metal-binding protein n=1 Tax=Nocardiopsis lambiniae TaxID=3075539 RepID=A0ABU2M434_9ACTN|nr:TIGR03086 family metal-binding protein [Nocardiopsis sp. DSM 44743]MDT0326900.1 TIGR03086 family metal-binding protein [Nocardiopsis sp. DSM 44743]